MQSAKYISPVASCVLLEDSEQATWGNKKVETESVAYNCGISCVAVL